jgi:hypothetical protein
MLMELLLPATAHPQVHLQAPVQALQVTPELPKCVTE